MICINNKRWEKLRATDIVKFLEGSDDEETFFFEYKSDDETASKLMKEISAFANTYGGYIFIGVNNDKSISGCRKWNEQRIHSTIYDSITPIPNFDVRRFKTKYGVVYVIKIEEGTMPPYITNKGEIYQRVSSGSFPIKDAAKLTQLYTKRQDQLAKTKRKIEFETLVANREFPQNLFGYIDLGFELMSSQTETVSDRIYSADLKAIAVHLRNAFGQFTISDVGYSLVITAGRASGTDLTGKRVLLCSGINNFIEIMNDGSVKCRVVLTGDVENGMCNITTISYTLGIFEEIYRMILGNDLLSLFVSARKYEKLTVLKQFVPCFVLGKR